MNIGKLILKDLIFLKYIASITWNPSFKYTNEFNKVFNILKVSIAHKAPMHLFVSTLLNIYKVVLRTSLVLFTIFISYTPTTFYFISYFIGVHKINYSMYYYFTSTHSTLYSTHSECILISAYSPTTHEQCRNCSTLISYC